MKVLLLGGTGNISYQVLVSLLDQGIKVTILYRGSSQFSRRIIDHPNLIKIIGDVNNKELLKLIAIDNYDIIVDFICYTKEQAHQRISLFLNKVKKYFFVSTTAFYSKNPKHLPYTENCPIDNLQWQYCFGKYQAEREFINSFERLAFPVVILRLAHTYDTVLPVSVGPSDWTIPNRILTDRPIIVHGDGTGIWSLLHAHDAASAIHNLISVSDNIGEVINVVSQERYTWLYITKLMYKILGKEENIVFVPSKSINKMSPYLGDGILNHKMWCDYYNNSKLLSYIPKWAPVLSLKDGLQLSLDWYKNNKTRHHISSELDTVIDQIVFKYINI